MNYVLFQNYEARIDALQKQVEEQSLTMSMISSYTPEDFSNEDGIFGEFHRFYIHIIFFFTITQDFVVFYQIINTRHTMFV